MPGTTNPGFMNWLGSLYVFLCCGFYPGLKTGTKQTKPKYFLALPSTFLVALKSLCLLILKTTLIYGSYDLCLLAQYLIPQYYYQERDSLSWFRKITNFRSGNQNFGVAWTCEGKPFLEGGVCFHFILKTLWFLELFPLKTGTEIL